MKHTLSILGIAVGALLFGNSIVFAEEENIPSVQPMRASESARVPAPTLYDDGSSRSGVRENAPAVRTEEQQTTMLEKRQEVEENIAERRDAAIQKMVERRSEILKRAAHRMIGRMSAAINRLQKIADRIDSRIEKLQEKGVDTTIAEANIAIARTKLEVAQFAVDSADAAIENAVARAEADALNPGSTPSDAGKQIRSSLENARQAVVAAHGALVDAIVSLRANVKTSSNLDTDTASTSDKSGDGADGALVE